MCGGTNDCCSCMGRCSGRWHSTRRMAQHKDHAHKQDWQNSAAACLRQKGFQKRTEWRIHTLCSDLGREGLGEVDNRSRCSRSTDNIIIISSGGVTFQGERTRGGGHTDQAAASPAAVQCQPAASLGCCCTAVRRPPGTPTCSQCVHAHLVHRDVSMHACAVTQRLKLYGEITVIL